MGALQQTVIVAGSIVVQGQMWTRASWLFDAVVSQLAMCARPAALRERLAEIVRENLGYLSIDELEPADRSELLWILGDNFPDSFNAAYPNMDPQHRPGALTSVSELVQLSQKG